MGIAKKMFGHHQSCKTFFYRIPPNSSKGVQRFQTKCEEGHVTWKNPIGALQINFKLRTEMKNIETCFRAAAFKTDVRFYWETTRDNGTTDLEPLCVLNELERSLRREICVQSESRDSVTLYVDAKSDVNSSTVGCVHIYYNTRKVILSQRTTAIIEGLYAEYVPCSTQWGSTRTIA